MKFLNLNTVFLRDEIRTFVKVIKEDSAEEDVRRSLSELFDKCGIFSRFFDLILYVQRTGVQRVGYSI